MRKSKPFYDQGVKQSRIKQIKNSKQIYKMAVQRKRLGYEKSKKEQKKNFFQSVTKSGFANNKKFWNTVKPFLTNKDFLTDDNISIKVNDELVTDKTKLANLFNLHYINIVENTSGVPPVIQENPNNPNEDNTTVKNIIKQYENHSSIINIKNHIDSPSTRFDIPTAKTEDINKIIKNINPKKATSPDKIPPKIVRLSAKIIDSHLMNIIRTQSLILTKCWHLKKHENRFVSIKLKIFYIWALNFPVY